MVAVLGNSLVQVIGKKGKNRKEGKEEKRKEE